MTPSKTSEHKPHDSSHERLLHEVITGDLQRSDERVRELERDCEVCRDYLRDSLEVGKLLDDVLGEQAASVAELEQDANAPGADRIAETLRALASSGAAAPASPARTQLRALDSPQRAPAPRRASATAWRVSLAAATVMIAGWLVRMLLPPSQVDPAGGDTTLGGNKNSRLEPSGEVSSFSSFTWDLGLDGRPRYNLQIWAAEDGLTSAPRLEKETWGVREWKPAAEQMGLIPEDFRWRVEAFDEAGQSLESAETRVDRPPLP